MINSKLRGDMRAIQAATLLLAGAVILVGCASASDTGGSKRHSRLFDPLFGYQDLDAHTVSLSAGSHHAAPLPVVQEFDTNQTATKLATLPSTLSPSTSGKILLGSASTSGRLASSEIVADPSLRSLSDRRRAEEPKHWSALEAYFKNLRHNVQQHQQQSSIYQLLVDQERQQQQRNRLDAANMLSTGSLSSNLQSRYPTLVESAIVQPVLTQQQQQQQLQLQQLLPQQQPQPQHQPQQAVLVPLVDQPRRPAFLLPIVSSSSSSSSPSSGTTSSSSTSLDPSPYAQTAPGISRETGIGGSSLLLDAANRLAILEQEQEILRQQQLLRKYQTQLQHVRPNQGHIIAYQAPYTDDSFALAPSLNTNFTSAGFANDPQLQQKTLQEQQLEGKQHLIEWRRLPELLMIQQQQERVRHQQETFGPWYDHQRSRELMHEEAFCGPRNFVRFGVLALTGSGASAAQTPASLTDLIRRQPSESQRQAQLEALRQLALADLQQGQTHPDSDQNHQVPVTLTAGEYPSHMGLYNGSQPSEDNYLCAATWVHERFALTLASCVNSVQMFANNIRLSVRAGEWNINRQTTTTNKSATDQRAPAQATTTVVNEWPMVVRQVKQIHLFPKYLNNSREHNLALLELAEPISYLDTPYISPACQIQSRTTIKTRSCWAPVRNVTMSEYFDAEGEGETKLKKSIKMVELPVGLIANDDRQCYKKTRIEFFNINYPNYICSADYKLAQWRQQLNQTEYFGSGVYCNEGGSLSLVSLLHPIHSGSSSAFGFLDLSYYRPWMRNVISGRAY